MSREGDGHGVQLERFREFLCLLARMQLDPRLQGKVDLSGVVQQTLVEAYQAIGQFQDWTEVQRTAWLRKTLTNNLTDEVRKLCTAKRDVGLERSLEATALEESSSRLDLWLAADQSTPSQQAIRHEQLLCLASALTDLSEDQRQAVELHYLRGLSLAEVSSQMSRSKGNVAVLLFRALKKLRNRLGGHNQGET